MKKSISVIIIAIITSVQLTNAKSSLLSADFTDNFAIKISEGPAYLYGDIGVQAGKEPFSQVVDWYSHNMSYMYSIGFQHFFANNLGFEGSFSKGRFSGKDEGTKRSARGYSYSSDLSIISLQANFILLGGPYSIYKTPHTLYAFSGLGYVMSNPDTRGPLDLINDKFSTNNQSLSMPFGLGYQYNLSKSFSVGLEVCGQYAFRDFVDGVLPIESKANDIIANVGLTVIYKLFTGSSKSFCLCSL